jgi:hypothetical protein
LQYNNENKISENYITSRASIHQLSRGINHAGKLFYGNCLDSKGASKVEIMDNSARPAGYSLSNKI